MRAGEVASSHIPQDESPEEALRVLVKVGGEVLTAAMWSEPPPWGDFERALRHANCVLTGDRTWIE